MEYMPAAPSFRGGRFVFAPATSFNNCLGNPVYSTHSVLCETFVNLVVKIFYHEEHEGFTKDTMRRVHIRIIDGKCDNTMIFYLFFDIRQVKLNNF